MMDYPYRLFPGSNTKSGFFSLFDEVFLRSDYERVFILKGGPGTGKSTLQKRIYDYAKNNEKVTCCHCSSDPSSLDGIILHKSKIAVIDGTAPHVIDPHLPGCSDEIINLADGLDTEKLTASREDAEAVAAEISTDFMLAHNSLSSACNARNAAGACYDEKHSINRCLMPILLMLSAEDTGSVGQKRSIFMSAMTPEGIRDFCEGIRENLSIYINVPWGYDMTAGFSFIADYAVMQGYDVFVCKNPIDGDRTEQLILTLDTHRTVITTHAHYEFTANEYIDLHSCVKRTANIEALRTLSAKYKGALAEATRYLASAKKKHDVLEAFYTGAMDYGATAEAYERIITFIDT